MPVTLESIRAARHRLGSSIYHSPCPYSLSLSRLCGCEIYCKLDHLQMTGSFKERGARNKLLLLTDDQRRAGVVAASAGNHAQGLAYHGQLLDIPVTVVMPRWAPIIKVANCRSFGATIILDGDSFDEARHAALKLADEKHLTFIPAFDDQDIISGQGTLGLEILEDVPNVDVVIVPVGGGGLIAGIATAIKSLRPQVRIIGAESTSAPTLHESLQRGQVTPIAPKPTLADGLAVTAVGQICFDIAQKLVDQVVLVDEPQIAQAIVRLLELEKTVVEGAGAVPLAAAMASSPSPGTPGEGWGEGPVRASRTPLSHPMNAPLDLQGKKVVLVLGGGNIDITLISRIIERGLAADGRLTRILAYVSDRPGSLAHLAGVIASTGASIKEVFHDRNFGPADVARVAVSCTLETRDAQHIHELHQALTAAGIEFRNGDAT